MRPGSPTLAPTNPNCRGTFLDYRPDGIDMASLFPPRVVGLCARPRSHSFTEYALSGCRLHQCERGRPLRLARRRSHSLSPWRDAGSRADVGHPTTRGGGGGSRTCGCSYGETRSRAIGRSAPALPTETFFWFRLRRKCFHRQVEGLCCATGITGHAASSRFHEFDVRPAFGCRKCWQEQSAGASQREEERHSRSF